MIGKAKRSSAADNGGSRQFGLIVACRGLAVLALVLAGFAATAASAFAEPPLTAKTEAFSNVSYTSAHVTGHVSTPGVNNPFLQNEVRFQYSTDKVNWTSGPTEYFGLTAEEKFVQADITGLKGGTTYYVRLTIYAYPNEAVSSEPYLTFTTQTVEPPTVSVVDDASEIFSRTAAVSGKVKRPANPDTGFNVTACHFEYVTDAQFTANGFQGATNLGCEFFNTITVPGEEEEVGAQLEGLAPSTTYHLRLVAENAAPTGGTKEGNPFTTNAKVTAKPVILVMNDASNVEKRSAHASGEIERPAGADPALDTECRFEYISEEQFTENIGNTLPGFEGAAQAACAQNPIRSSDGNAVTTPVSVDLGLTPGTTYHLRLTAENGAGAEFADAASTFTTPAIVHPELTANSVSNVDYTKARFTFTVGPGNQGAYGTVSYSVAGTNEWFGDAPNNGFWGINPGEAPRQYTVEFGPYGTQYEIPPAEGGGYYYQPGPGLVPGTKYEVRVAAFDTDEYIERYSEPLEFMTKGTSTLPSVELDPVTTSPPSNAHFTGFVHINAPAGPLPDDAKAAYKTHWHLQCTPQCEFPNFSGTIETDEGGAEIDVESDRLESNTFYENVTLIAENGLGTSKTPVQHFSTPLVLPSVRSSPGGSAGSGSFNVGGIVTPFNSKISNCHFEYGPTTEYVYSAPCSPDPVGRNEVQRIAASGIEGQFKLIFRGQITEDIDIQAPAAVVESELRALSAIGPEGVTDVEREIGFFNTAYTIHFSGPLSSQNVGPIHGIEGTHPLCVEPNYCHLGDPGDAQTLIEGGNNSPVLVEAHLTGLTPGATYHYRIAASNPLGTVRSGDNTFVPPLATAEVPCPNEAERAESSSGRLPECRAYELVTSAPKAGSSASLFQFAENESLAYTSNAGNIEGSGQGFLAGNYYVAQRTDTGWETLPHLNGPRGSIFAPPFGIESAYIVQYGANLRNGIWWVFKPGRAAAGAPFLREPNGEFTQMSDPPEFGEGGYPTGLYAGASTDLTHTFWYGMGYGFFPDGWAPGVGPGLYEFEGVGNSGLPKRVDVDDSGTPLSECRVGPRPPEGAVNIDTASSDGKTVFFNEKECEGHPEELWARVDGSKSYFLSESQCTRTAADPGGACNAPANPFFWAATTDGLHTVFTTKQQLLDSDTNESNDLYLYDMPTASDPSPSLIDVSGTAGPNAQVEQVTNISNDGNTIYFVAKGVLASNHDALDAAPLDGDRNLYVWHRDAGDPEGQTTFIGPLTGATGIRGEITPDDGRYFAFETGAQLVPTDTDNANDIYRYDDSTGELIRVSVDAAGTGGNADGLNAEIKTNQGGIGNDGRFVLPTSGEHPSMTDNGEEIVFTSNEALSADDGNGAADDYIWKDGRTSLITTGSVGGGASTAFVFGGSAVIDGSGKDIYFTSTQQLTPNDTDSVEDVYVARINGGYSFAKHEGCSGEACQPSQAAGGNSVPGPGSHQSKGNGNYQRATVSLKALSSSQLKILAAGGGVRLGVRVSGAGAISVKGSAVVHRKLVQVVSVKSRAVQPGLLTLPLSLSRSALTRLRSAGKLTVQLSAVVADSEPATLKLKLKSAETRRKHSKKGNG